jgi:hypothetical protein
MIKSALWQLTLQESRCKKEKKSALLQVTLPHSWEDELKYHMLT